MPHKQAHTDAYLRKDVTDMIEEFIMSPPADLLNSAGAIEALAKEIITVVREGVLREIGTYARNNIR